jgi:ribonuclease P protein component
MTSSRHTFSKAERLTSRKLISEVFAREGTSQAFHYPMLASWRVQSLPGHTFPAQVLFSVPKRKWRHAHDRNRIRRQMREAWRKQKNLLYDPLSAKRLQYAVVMVYTAQENVSFDELYHACGKLLEKMASAAA